MDEEFQKVCRNLLRLAISRENAKRQVTTSSRAAADMLSMAIKELPHARLRSDLSAVRMHEGSSVASTSLAKPTPASVPESSLTFRIIHMAKIKACLNDACSIERTLHLDSGAVVSCISMIAWERDAKHLLPQAQLHRLLTPITLSGFASGYSEVSLAAEAVRLVIGRAKCSHNFLIVPGLICDYLLGQDFLYAYSLLPRPWEGTASMGIPPEEWVGDPDMYACTQDVHLSFAHDKTILKTLRI